MKNIDSHTHVSGQSVYLDDIPLTAGTLFGASFGSPIAHGIISALDFEEALQVPGVIRIFTYKDIPGENQIGGIIPDDHYWQNTMYISVVCPSPLWWHVPCMLPELLLKK